MISYHGIGYWALLIGLPLALLLRVLPRGSAAHQTGARVLLAGLTLIAALVYFSY